MSLGNILHDSETGTDTRAGGDNDYSLEGTSNAENTGNWNTFDPVVGLRVVNVASCPVAGVGDDERAAGLTAVTVGDASKGVPFTQGRFGNAETTKQRDRFIEMKADGVAGRSFRADLEPVETEPGEDGVEGDDD